MENTCNYQNCQFAAQLFNKPEQCPFYVESWWKPLEGQPELVKDCANKRIFLMVQNLHDRLIGVQQSQEQQRNESTKILRFAEEVLSATALKHDQTMVYLNK